MLASVTELLRCIRCDHPGPLSLEAGGKRKGEQVMEGALTCLGCGARWPIEDGIADFVGDLLQFRVLVVVRDDDGAFLCGFRLDLFALLDEVLDEVASIAAGVEISRVAVEVVVPALELGRLCHF